jgi:hypothetical protein
MVFAQLTRDLAVVQRGVGVRAGRLAPDGSEFFHNDQRGEDVADFLGQLWVLLGVLGDRRAFSPAIALEKFFGQLIHRIVLGTRTAHGWNSFMPPGMLSRISLSRFKARI